MLICIFVRVVRRAESTGYLIMDIPGQYRFQICPVILLIWRCPKSIRRFLQQGSLICGGPGAEYMANPFFILVCMSRAAGYDAGRGIRRGPLRMLLHYQGDIVAAKWGTGEHPSTTARQSRARGK